MVYESDFYTTRRTGSHYTRPTISSYTVTTPLRYSGVPRLDTFTTTTTTYRTPMPYVAHKRIVPVTRFASSPARVLYSPVRVLGSSSVRILGSPVRVYGSPVRVISSPVRTVVRAVRSPVRVITSPARIVTVRSSYLRPSIVNKEFDRIERKYRASPVSSALEQYYNSPSYLEFEDEKREIRNSSAMLLRQLNDPVPRVMAPQVPASVPLAEPNPKKWVYDPFSSHNKYNSDTYVKSTITDPLRSVARDIEAMARYHSPASRYVEYVLLDDILWRYTYYVDDKGKNHLASTRIIGSKAYPKTKPRIYNYDTARVGREVNVMSHYSANRSQAKSDVDEVYAAIERKRQRRRQRAMIRDAKEALEDYNFSKLPKKTTPLYTYKKRKALADAVRELEQEQAQVNTRHLKHTTRTNRPKSGKRSYRTPM